MDIRFQSKEESNKQQIDDFLKLSKIQRLYSFLRMMEQIQKFPIKNKQQKNKDNFIIVINTE
jgi:hypothetical protein